MPGGPVGCWTEIDYHERIERTGVCDLFRGVVAMINLSGLRWLSRGAGRVLLSLLLLAGGLGWGISTAVVACPFCAAPSLT